MFGVLLLLTLCVCTHVVYSENYVPGTECRTREQMCGKKLRCCDDLKCTYNEFAYVCLVQDTKESSGGVSNWDTNMAICYLVSGLSLFILLLQ